MRLITTQVYRAFPELDGYSDEQCRRFVRAAGALRLQRGLHGVAILVVAFLGCVTTGIAASLVLNVARPYLSRPTTSEGAEAVILGMTMVAVLLTGGCVCLVLKDFSLRRRIRFVLSVRGACVSCHYSLVGLPIGARNRVRCPECGEMSEVDTSLVELVKEGKGGASVGDAPD